MGSHQPLMLVSAVADATLRRQVEDQARPRPEYLVLESEYGVELLDWSLLPGRGQGRSPWRSAIHAATALRRLNGHSVVFSDGEHVGIPLGLAMRTLGIDTPHLVIGHHMTHGPKSRLMRSLGAHQGMSRILVHSARQLELARDSLGIPDRKLAYVPYYADTEFWSPGDLDEEPLVVAAGREHRDYRTLALAAFGLAARVFVASGSVHSPAASSLYPDRWPDNFEVGFADYRSLRTLYRRASVVVVPLVDSDFQAGVTTVLEAMAVGKPVVVTHTRGQSTVVRDGVTGITVRPGEPEELGQAIRYLLDHPVERRRIGTAARESVIAEYSVEAYAQSLAGHLEELVAARRIAA